MDSNSAPRPLVSVGIPTYSRAEGLRRALECVTGQTYRSLEIIVSDNASPGTDTEAVVRSFMQNDLRIRYFRQPQNIGATSNFQFVLNQANGKYFLWCADDDLCEPSFIDALVSCMEHESGIVLAMTDVKVIAGDDSFMRVERLETLRSGMVNVNSIKVRRLFFRYPTSNIFFCIYGLYRTDVVKAASLNVRSWRNYLFCSEVPFLAQIAVRGGIASVPGPLKLYRSHADSYYIRELPQVTQLDRLIRGAEIRLQLASIALSCDLGWRAKCALLASIGESWIRSGASIVYHFLVRAKQVALGDLLKR